MCDSLMNIDKATLTYSSRGRHASKMTEEEEDEEYLKEEEEELAGSGSTRLLVQPSCKCHLTLSNRHLG